MIFVTQGHECGVGLEVFIKAALCLRQSNLDEYLLVTDYSSLQNTLETLSIQYTIENNALQISNLKIKLFLLGEIKISPSTDSLNYALKNISKTDILLTLPTSKDQLMLDGKKKNGYTEFFREFFKDPNISMNFLSHDQNISLLSDHISINDVLNYLTHKNILNKITLTLESLKGIREIKDIYFSGIDPHCGESGQISKYDYVFDKVILDLEKKFPSANFFGPYPADTLHLKYENRTDQLFIYAYHDQGLAPFKYRNGLIGINLSLGLPFKRVSVDHGTAFDLYGKNSANYLGMLFLLKEIKNWT